MINVVVVFSSDEKPKMGEKWEKTDIDTYLNDNLDRLVIGRWINQLLDFAHIIKADGIFHHSNQVFDEWIISQLQVTRLSSRDAWVCGEV